MNEKKSPIKNFILRAIFFSVCLAMFLYGAIHYMDRMPYAMKKPVIKLQRFLKARKNRTRVEDQSLSLERRSQALRQLQLLNVDDLQGICAKVAASAQQQLKKQALECLLQVGTQDALENVFLNLDSTQDSVLSFRRAVDLISSNPNGQSVLKGLLEKKDLSETLRLSILGTLAQNNKDYQDQLQEMFDAASKREQRHHIIEILTLASPDNPVVVEYHQKNVNDPKANRKTSLVYLAHRGDPWLRENFLNLYREFDFEEKKQLLDLAPYLCPTLQIDKWKSEFLKSNSFALKERIFTALLIYRINDREQVLKQWLADPKLRPKEVDLLKDKASLYINSEKQVCR